LSEKYSNSPALCLKVAASDTRCALYAALCVCAGGALWLVAAGGYTGTAALLLPAVLVALWRLRRQRLCGATLRWERGDWMLECDGECRALRLLPGSGRLPWLICLVWRELPAGRRGGLWLFPDSAPARELRRLRVRLVLEGY
jgi:hypothetical protein